MPRRRYYRRRRPRREGFPHEMYNVICSDCGKEAEVPFRPIQGSPVYCRECFQKHRLSRRAGGRPSRKNVCFYCSRIIRELPYQCHRCGRIFCSIHHLPETHTCKGLSGRDWHRYRRERKKWGPEKPAKFPTWIPSREPAREPPIFEYPETEKPPEKYEGLKAFVGIVAKLAIIAIVGLVMLTLIAQSGILNWISIPATHTESLPPNYYGVAISYVATHYNPVGEKNITNLATFLNQIQFRDYVEDAFDCSEASSMLEWLLEGAGFNASIATNATSAYTFAAHTWVLVTLDGGGTVAIEATSLTQNYYASPGIVEDSDGRFREYTYDYKMFLEWKEEHPPNLYAYDPNITFEEWKAEYLIQILSIGIPSHETYYNPPKIYASPEDAVKPQYYGGETYYTPISEFDWWNASPYNSMTILSEWD